MRGARPDHRGLAQWQASLPPHGCVGDGGDVEQFACVAGQPPDCSCDDDDCAAPDAGYSDGSCPDVVLAAEPSAVCPTLTEDRCGALASDDLGDASGCRCRCTRCANTCDGVGSIVGVFDRFVPLPLPQYTSSIDLVGLMPERGRMGVYLRIRGWAPGHILAIDTPKKPFSVEALYDTIIIEDFKEFVAYGLNQSALPGQVEPGVAPDVPVTWTNAGDAPTTILLSPYNRDPGATEAGGGIVEIDCVIPF